MGGKSTWISTPEGDWAHKATGVAGTRGDGSRRGRHSSRRRAVRKFVQAALVGEQADATATAVKMTIQAQSRAAVITDLFEAAQRFISERWQLGEATTDDEYQVSRTIAAAMSALPRFERPRLQRASKALLVTMAPEEHDLGLELVAQAMQDDAWGVELWRSVDPTDLIDGSWWLDFDLLGVSSTYRSDRLGTQLKGVVRNWRAAGKPVLVGGLTFRRFPTLVEEVGADAIAPDARSALVMARRLRHERHRWSIHQHAKAI